MTLVCFMTSQIRRECSSILRSITLSLLLLLTCLVASGKVAAAEVFEVVVLGVEGRVQENVEAALAIPHGLVRDGRVEPVWAKRFARQARDKAVRSLEPFGYYAPEVTTDLESLADDSYRLTVTVTPGDPARIVRSSVLLSGPGADRARLKQLATNFPLVTGDPLRHDLYETGKGQLLATATELGYLEARFIRHKVSLNREKRQAEIDLELDTGPQYSFGEVSFHGADDFPEPVLRRYLAFNSGEAFAESKLSLTQANLFDADKFRSAQVVADRDQAKDQAVPVRIVLEPIPRYQLRPGLGYGTDTGPRASLRFRDINTFHLGHELQADLLYAQLRQTLTGRYIIPLASRLESLMAFSVQYDREVNDIFDTSALSTEASLTHGFAKGYKTTLFVNLSRESYQVGEEESRTTTLVMPGVRVAQRRWKFDSPGRPSDGYSWQIEVRGSSAALGSDVSLLQGMINSSAIMRLPWQTQLILRAEGGTTWQDGFNDLPASMRFFAGGDQSVRGYGYKSLGPKDSNGDVIGGRHLATGSIELERRVVSNWSLALFYDTGNAFDDFNDIDLAHGTGLGVRRHTPIGPIKLDLARQIGHGNNDFRIHLSVGFGW